MTQDINPQHLVTAVGMQRDANANEWAKAAARASALELALAVANQKNEELEKIIAGLKGEATSPAND